MSTIPTSPAPAPAPAASPTSSVNTTPNAGSSDTATANQGLNSNYQDFLTLLTTQLQNQDPTAPADTNQITQEIASLSQVQQQININSNLQQLISLFTASQTNNAVSYIGKEIDTAGNQAILSGGVAAMAYNLPAGTSSAQVTITNAAGQTVFSAPGTTIAGRNQVFWDGTDGTTGQTDPDGTYTYTVTAKDSGGNPLTATTYTTGIVTSVDTQNGSTNLSIGNVSIPLSSVLSVRDTANIGASPPPVSSPSPATTTS